MPCKRLDILKLIQQFDIGLANLRVLFIEFIGKGATFAIFDMLHLDVARVVNIEHIFAFLPDAFQFAEVMLIGAEWGGAYTFWL
jgi:hypothetical protein